MVDTPNNYQSIVGGILRGLTNNKASGGLAQHNVTVNNPHTFRWIGQETNDLRQPSAKEQTQTPQLPWYKGTSGTQYEYTIPVPTDITTPIAESVPSTDISPTTYASSIGSLVQPVPNFVPRNNMQFNGYQMLPTSGEHFKTYFANQIGTANRSPSVLASAVAAGVGADQNMNIATGHDWLSFYNVMQTIGKRYDPNNQLSH